MDLGVSVLPDITKDATDRNRTSPFAFTGNKFEFRMLGSAINIACPNIMINTMVAEELRLFADELEGAADFKAAVFALIKREVAAHKRIIFNGNGYDDAWVAEAEKRGLHNLKSTAEALPHNTDEANVELFARHNVYTREEMESREEALLEEYYKTLHIEALTMSDMVREEILPACVAYEKDLADTVKVKKDAGVAGGMEAACSPRLRADRGAVHQVQRARPGGCRCAQRRLQADCQLLSRCDPGQDGRGPCVCRSAGDAGGQEVLAVPDLLGYPVLRVSDNRAAGRTHAGCGSWKQPVVTAYNTMACTSRTERCGGARQFFGGNMKI